MIRELFTRLRFLIARRPPGELDEELQFHLDQSTDLNIAAGMTPGEARRQALIEFGGVERTREQCGEQHPGWFLSTLGQDIRYALRGFRRNPVFAVTVIATLALGIGTTTAVFSVVDRILFRSLPYACDDRLVSVGLVAPIIPEEFMLGGSYYEWRDNQKPFEAFTSETGVNECNLTERNPARLSCASVEATFLPTLGVSPVLGRNFLPEEDRPNGPRVALLSYGVWQSRYGRDAAIVNQLIDIDGNQVRVVGVLPKDFEMPTLEAADVLLPQALNEAEQRNADPGRVMYAFARLRPGVSIEQARSALGPVFGYSLSLAPPAFRKEVHLQVRSIRDRQVHDVRVLAWVLLGAVFAVLLIACANVASLLMARGAARERELAVRSALGASGARLARQAFTEVALLALFGGAAGLALAGILLRVFIAIAPAGIPYLAKAQLDLRIMAFAVAVALLCGSASGLLPSLKRPSAMVLTARFTRSGARTLLRRVLVAGQIAVSMVLLAGASLLLRSFRNLEQQTTGVQTPGVVAAHIPLPGYRYPTAQKRMEFFLRAEASLRRLPGVQAVGIGSSLPPGEVHGEQIYNNMMVEGKPHEMNGTGGMVAWRSVTPDYFAALGIPIERGRSFTENERSSVEHTIILSHLLAVRMFGESSPVGQRIRVNPNGPWCEVVGVAANVKNAGLAGVDEPEFYRLRRNLSEDWNGSAALVLKTAGTTGAAAGWIRIQIAEIDPTVPVEIEPLAQNVSKLADRPRFETALLGFFALCGLSLAVIGLYGVIAYIAQQRTQEIGVRMALGATRLDILRMVAGEGARLILLGGTVGLVAALAAARLLKSMLFNVRALDPASFAVTAMLLALVALVATLLPARAAMRVEPVAALRCE